MIIKVTSDPNFTDTVMGVKITNGLSESHFNQHQIDYLRTIGRFEFEVLDMCPNCEQKKQLIKELELRIEQLEEKLRKKVSVK